MSDRDRPQLVARAQSGDKLAFGLLVEKYQRKLARLSLALHTRPGRVEDVTQEGVIKAYRALPHSAATARFTLGCTGWN